MKTQYKYLIVLVTLLLVFSVSGCSKGVGADVPAEKPNPTVITETQDDDTGSLDNIPSADSAEKPDTVNASKKPEDVDVDLTVMSSTMIFAEVQNMMMSPDQFLGKTVRMKGPYTPLFYEVTETFYHYIIIPDATACCEQGIEFIWTGDHSYPLDYPKEKTEIEVSGVFSSYEELEITYYYIETDDIKILT